MNLTASDKAAIIEQYTSGLSVGALAKLWHRDHRTLQRVLRKAGIRLRTPGESRKLTAAAKRATRKLPVAEIVGYYSAGNTLRACEIKFGLHHYTIKQVVKAAGVFRSRSEAKRRQMATLSDSEKQALLQATWTGYGKWRDAGGVERRRKPIRKKPAGKGGLMLVDS